MPSILVVLAGILVGADTGLQMRRLPEPPSEQSSAASFPALSAASGLLVGIALAEAALLALLEHIPELAGFITGPMLVILGLVWLYDAIQENRLRPLRADGKRAVEDDGSPFRGAPLRQQLGFGLRMGLLLPAAGIRTLPMLTVSLLTAIALATATQDALRGVSSSRVGLPTIVRTAAGGLLCALGIGDQIERVSHGAVSSFQIALPLAVFAWGACVFALWRSPNS